jgi:hypothetical protein
MLAQYSQNQATTSAVMTDPLNSGYVTYAPSLAGELNRVQDSVDLSAQWHLAPETILSLGYQFQIVNYTGNQIIGYNDVDPNVGINGYYSPGYSAYPYYSDTRDNYSHIVYVGYQHNFLPDLVGAAKAGVQYNDEYNAPAQYGDSTSWSPYADLSMIYTYLPGCNAQIGFTQMRNATDIAQVASNGSLTLDQQSSSVHASINHHLTPKLLLTAIGSWTASTYRGGPYNDATDEDLSVGLSANYNFTRHVSGEIDYNYDDLTSSVVDRAYNRNRITIGLSVAY